MNEIEKITNVQHDILKEMYRVIISYLDNNNEYNRDTRKYEGKTYFTYRRQDYSATMMMPMSADSCTPRSIVTGKQIGRASCRERVSSPV